MRLKKHSIFTRNGNNVFCDIPITFTQATLGADLEIPMVDGSKVKYKIPDGTQPGTKFTIKTEDLKLLMEIIKATLFLLFWFRCQRD